MKDTPCRTDRRSLAWQIVGALIVVWAFASTWMGTAVFAQKHADGALSGEGEWQLVLDGEEVEWPDSVPRTGLDSVRSRARAVVNHIRREGYYYARLDSAVVDTAVSPPSVYLYARRGREVAIGELRIHGAEIVPVAEIRRMMDTGKGAPLNPARLEADIEAILDRYEEIGRPLTEIHITDVSLDPESGSRLRLTLQVNEGPKLWLKEIEVPDGARTSPGLVARLAELEVGEPLVDYDPQEIRTSLRQSPFFESVGTPTMRVTSDGGAILHIPVEEAAPGAFDVVVGYLPSTGGRRGGQLVGSGHLLLEHLFGGGRRVDLTLDRRPGQTSIFDVSVSDPYIFGLPFRVLAQFKGEQRDSTYGERTYGLTAGYHFSRTFDVSGRLSREVVKPGQAGARIRNDRQRIPRSRTHFYGVGLRYESVDRKTSPRHGFRADVDVDQGRKERSRQRITAEGDTTRLEEALRQERFRASVRGFLPLFDRQVLVLGGDASVIRSQSYDRSDLFRFGGAESLRGYDEDRFSGNVTLRGLLEYRLQLDRRSYVYAFGDLGYLERPPIGESAATQEWHPGYGLGVQVSTTIGLISTTYALNPDVSTPLDGRIHFGLSVGL